MATGLEALEGLILDAVICKLGPKHAAVAACVSSRLRSAASDDDLWRRFCAADFDLGEPVDPDGNPCPSFKETYKIWFKSFGMYPLPLVRRAKKLWTSMRRWLAENFHEALITLNKGASEAEIKAAEEGLGFKLPMPTKVLYRFCNGQQTVFVDDPSERKKWSFSGIIGGYEYYDHIVNVHLLPLNQAVKLSRQITGDLGFSTRSKYIVVAASCFIEKFFFLNCINWQLYVGTGNLIMDGEMIPCVPNSLIRPTLDSDNNMPQDALLLWLEEHLMRLDKGIIRTRRSRNCPRISLYPEAPPFCSSAITNGVKIIYHSFGLLLVARYAFLFQLLPVYR